MRQFWVYDWEVYYNFSCVSFIHTTTPLEYVKAYQRVDIKRLDVERQIDNLVTLPNYDIKELESLEQLRNKYKEQKRKLLGVMNVKSFIIYRDRNDSSKNICQLGELLMFFHNHKVLIGYNSYNYDSLITDFILCRGKDYNPVTGKNKNNIHITEDLKRVSDEVINVSRNKLYYYRYSWLPVRYTRLYEDYDIQKILYLDKTFVGLKSVAINLKWYRIQELPLPPESIIEHNQVFLIYDYNINDILITFMLVMNQQEEITLREQISERYNINVLNESRSSIGKKLMSKYYSEAAEIDYKNFRDLRTHRGRMSLGSIITNKVHFKTDKFKSFLKEIKQLVITPNDKFEKHFSYNNTTYTIAKGGIHSIDDSRKYDSLKDGYIYRDADVTSYYPSILIIFKIAPEHLIKEIFLKLITFFKNDRVAAKHDGRKLEAEALKIVINRIYGALKDINDYLFDPKATYMTTMNGQLSLLMLIEKLETNDIHVISANTDGIVSRFKPEQEQLYNDLCKEWENETGFELEYTDYEKYVRNNVNEYVAVKKGFYDKITELKNKHLKEEDYLKERKELEDKYVKGKGDFITETPFNKGFVHPVVSIALREYILYDTSYEDTIYNHWKKDPFNIYDYCISQKVDKKFAVYFNYVDDGIIKQTLLQQYNRFYVSTIGGGITKEYDGSASRLVAGKKLMILNDYQHKEDYNIDFKYYIRKVEEYLYYRKKNSKGNHKFEGIEVRGTTLFD